MGVNVVSVEHTHTHVLHSAADEKFNLIKQLHNEGNATILNITSNEIPESEIL